MAVVLLFLAREPAENAGIDQPPKEEAPMFESSWIKVAGRRGGLGIVVAGVVCGAAVWPISHSAGAAAQNIPALASVDFGWLADTEFLPPPSGPGPVTFDKAHPYIRNNTTGQPTFRIADTTNPILQRWAAEQMNKSNQEVLAGKFAFTARSSCWPAGVPGFMVFGCGARTVYFLQTPKVVTMINDGDQQIRHVYLDVKHSAHVVPSWYGESIGHYEGGDTLVIDTIGLNDQTFIDNYRTPHTSQLHVIERWKLTEGGKTLDVSIRVDDPGAFTMPWSARQIYHRADQGPLTEMVCAENNANYFGQDVIPIPRADRPDF
jgi:hypothetical protein